MFFQHIPIFLYNLTNCMNIFNLYSIKSLISKKFQQIMYSLVHIKSKKVTTQNHLESLLSYISLSSILKLTYFNVRKNKLIML